MTMKSPLLRTGIVLAALMFAASALAMLLRPSILDLSQAPPINLADRVPMAFGEWQVIEASNSIVVNPQQEEVLNRIYSDVLNRSYKHATSGKFVMLSIAYGAVQNKQSQVHRPEVCYPAQGFQIVQSERALIDIQGGAITVRRLVAKTDKRMEPLTYWIRVGDRLAQGWIEQKYAVVMEGLAGRVSDGLIFRVSTIDANLDAAFSLQGQFIDELLSSLSPTDKQFLIGESR